MMLCRQWFDTQHMITRTRLTLYPEMRVFWLPTRLVKMGQIHGSGQPVVTNENPLFRSRLSALVHGDGEWNKRCRDEGYRQILPQLLTNRRISAAWFHAALRDKFTATALVREVGVLFDMAEQRARENTLPRSPWHHGDTSHFWGDEYVIEQHDIWLAQSSAQDALDAEKRLWQMVSYTKDLPPNEMEQFTPGEAPPYIESVVHRRRK